MFEVLKTLGATFGIFAFLWKVWDLFQSYLHIDASVEIDNGIPVIYTIVENKSLRSKKIENAFLLIGPEDEDVGATYNAIAERHGWEKAKSTNDFAKRMYDVPLFEEAGRMIIPLSFYYRENVRIADERLSYAAPLVPSKLTPETPYSARFYVTGEGRLHRSTHTCFVIAQKRTITPNP